jgi:predicted RNase H-like HicB family nuclease
LRNAPHSPAASAKGSTKPETLSNIKEAIEGWLETAEAPGQPIPEERFDVQVVCV